MICETLTVLFEGFISSQSGELLRAQSDVQSTLRAAYKRRRHHNDKGKAAIYAALALIEEKREAVMAIEAAVLPLIEQSSR